MRPFKAISSVNALERLYVALNTGKWMSKKGLVLDEVDEWNAVFQTILGVQSQRSVDTYTKQQSAKQFKEKEEKYIQKFVEQWKRGMRIQRDDPEGARDYFQQALVHLWQSGAREDRLPNAWARATAGDESLADQIDWNYYIKNAPKEMQDKFKDAYIRTERLKQMREGQ
jgi:hypothetical protein